jgi:hypothetical protein
LVSGEAGTAYTITLPQSAVLSFDGNSMTVDSFVDSKGGNATIDASGADTFKVEATLNVGAGQPNGTYTGSYTITVASQ